MAFVSRTGDTERSSQGRVRCLLGTVLAVALLSVAAGSLAGARGQDRPRFRAESFANLHELRVLNSEGKPIHGLAREDFQAIASDVRELPLVYFEEQGAAPVCVALLIDTGSSMSSQNISTAKEFAFQLIHLLDRDDEILLATYDSEIHFLSRLTSDRHELVEGIWNIAPGGRPGKWARLGNLFVSESATGYAIDHALLMMKKSRHNDKVVVALSAGFGNIGPATEDHLNLAGARLFGVSFDSKLMDVFNLAGDQMARKRILKETGGIAWAGDHILERVEAIRDTLKSYYLSAYQTPEEEKADDLKVTFRVRSHPEYQVYAARRTKSGSSFY